MNSPDFSSEDSSGLDLEGELLLENTSSDGDSTAGSIDTSDESLSSNNSIQEASVKEVENSSGKQGNAEEKVKDIKSVLLDNLCYKILITFLYFLLYLGKGFSQMGIALTLTDLSDFQNVEKKTVRLYSMVFRGLGLICSSYVIGKLCQNAKPTKWYHMNLHHIVCTLTFCGYCLPQFLVPLLPYAYIGLPLNFLWGVGANTTAVGCQILSRLVWPNKRMTAAVYQSFLFAYALGCLIFTYGVGRTIFKYIEDWSSQKTLLVIYYMAACFQSIPCILLFCLPAPSAPRLIPEGGEYETLKKKQNSSWLYRKCYTGSFLQKDLSKLSEIFSREEEKNSSFFHKLCLFVKYKRDQYELLRILFFFFMGVTYILHMSHIKMFQNLIPSYCEDKGWTRENAAYASSVFFITYAISRFIAIFIQLIIDSTFMIGGYLILSVITLLGMWIFNGSDIALWIGFGAFGFACSPIFAAIAQIPLCYMIEPTEIERSLMLSPLGVGSGMPGIVGYLMSINPDWYIWSANGIGFLNIISFACNCFIGWLLKRRYEKEEEKVTPEKVENDQELKDQKE